MELNWKLSDLDEITPNGLRVFSCFHCGGGSTLGYKLAGCKVLGGVEIDEQMIQIYRRNHNPEYSYLMGVEEFNKIPNDKLPEALFKLDILDGSPPCSSFSMAGSREDAWGEKKKFREGQTDQVLDDLFFHYIATAKKLQPKVVIAENVKGLVIGKARGYVKEIFKAFDDAGYDAQLFLLNSAFMGVPQRRERTFFIAKKKSMYFRDKLKLEFNESPINFSEIKQGKLDDDELKLTPTAAKYWPKCKQGQSFSSIHEKGSLFNWVKVSDSRPLPTITSHNHLMFHSTEPRRLSNAELILGQTFPQDFDFLDVKPGYVMGMSVPPFMMQRIAQEIFRQWLK